MNEKSVNLNKFEGSTDYVASEELMRAVNIAMALQKPLLIKGEPGTGKTMLAQSISNALGKKLIIWNIKSTTKAQDGLYVYDVVQRLYDSQFGGEGVDDIKKYVHLGKVGEAFSSDEQVILLIDEKNDLLVAAEGLADLAQMDVFFDVVNAFSSELAVVEPLDNVIDVKAVLSLCRGFYVPYNELFAKSVGYGLGEHCLSRSGLAFDKKGLLESHSDIYRPHKLLGSHIIRTALKFIQINAFFVHILSSDVLFWD